MAYTNNAHVNKNSFQIPVYNDEFNPTIQIGRIYPREVFILYSGQEPPLRSVAIRNSAGNLVWGAIRDTVNGVSIWPNIKRIDEYPYQENVWMPNFGGYTDTLYARSTRTIYTHTGRQWGAVAAGRRVGISMMDQSLCGDNHPDWLLIRYVESSSGQWVKVSGDGEDYGFVNMGLAGSGGGSGYPYIPLYGSW